MNKKILFGVPIVILLLVISGFAYFIYWYEQTYNCDGCNSYENETGIGPGSLVHREKTLAFPQSEYSFYSGDLEDISFGVQNLGEEEVILIVTFEDLNECEEDCAELVFNLNNITLKPGQKDSYYFRFLAPETKNSYIYKMVILNQESQEVFASKSFYVEVI
jgi:hypothetical protein